MERRYITKFTGQCKSFAFCIKPAFQLPRFFLVIILCGCAMKSRPKLKEKPSPIIDNTMYELVLSILIEDSNNLYSVHKEIVSMGKYKITKIEKR